MYHNINNFFVVVLLWKSATYKSKYTLRLLLCKIMMRFTPLKKVRVQNLMFGTMTSTFTCSTELKSSFHFYSVVVSPTTKFLSILMFMSTAFYIKKNSCQGQNGVSFSCRGHKRKWFLVVGDMKYIIISFLISWNLFMYGLKNSWQPQFIDLWFKKSRIRETKNLLTDADSSTDKILERLRDLSIKIK